MKTDTKSHDRHDHGDGLHEDLVKLASRRDALQIFGAGSAAAILATLGASNALAATPTGEVPSETAGPYPGGRLQRPRRARRLRHRAPRHPPQLRRQPDAREGRPAARQPHRHRRLQGLRADGRARRVPVALRPLRQVLDVLVRRRGRELPARDREDRQRGHGLVQDDLPRLLFRPLAPHPLRGLLVGRQGRLQRPDRQDVADRVAASGRARRCTRQADTRAA